MRGGRKRVAFAGTLALALALAVTVGLSAGAAAKKGGGNKPFSETKAVNLGVPPTPAAGVPKTPLISEIRVPKKFKGKVVGDVNVTGIQTTGSGPDAAEDLDVYLTAPNGRTTLLFIAIGDQSIGPLTLDDDTRTSICNSPLPPTCADPDQSLARPFAGTANLLSNGLSSGPLSSFDGVKMRGTWSLRVFDAADPTTTVLNQWGLRLKVAKPVSE